MPLLFYVNAFQTLICWLMFLHFKWLKKDIVVPITAQWRHLMVDLYMIVYF